MPGSLEVAFQGARPVAFHTTCILVPCSHGWNLGAGVLDCRPPLLAAQFVRDETGNLRRGSDTGSLCVDDVCLEALPGRWWMAEHLCMRCPHGFAGSGDLVFAGACFLRECVLEVAETTRRAAVADIELPLQSDPIRWPNEWRLPLGEVAPNCLPFLWRCVRLCMKLWLFMSRVELSCMRGQPWVFVLPQWPIGRRRCHRCHSRLISSQVSGHSMSGTVNRYRF